MLIVNNAVPNTVSFYPSETKATQAAPLAETHAGLTSELNTKLIKELIAQLASPNKPDKFDAIRATLGQYGLDTSGEDFNNSKMLAALERLKTVNDGAQPSDDVAEMLANQEQRVKSTDQALSDIQRDIVTDRTKANYSFSQLSAEKQKAALKAVPESKSSDDEKPAYSDSSYAKMWNDVADYIKDIKRDYVDTYANLMKLYADMYAEYNQTVQAAASKAVTAGDDGNNVHFDETLINDAIKDFNGWIEKNATNLGDLKGLDDNARKSMKKTLAPAFSVGDTPPYKISFNLDQFTKTPPVPAGIKDGKCSTASYQAWLASFNASGSALQSNMQAFAQRYSQANSTFDNLCKVLSGSIEALAESAKAVLKALS